MKKKWYILSLLITLCALAYGLKYLNSAFFKQTHALPEPLSSIKNNHGTYIEYFNNNSIKLVSNYAHGKKHGPQLYFKENGDTLKTENYHAGLLNGLGYTYDSRGERIIQEYFYQGEKTSENILNDSIYKYDVLALETGESIFTQHCSSCHALKQNLNLGSLTSLPEDSTHSFLMDSEIKDTSATIALLQVDKTVLIQYLESLKPNKRESRIPLLVFRKKRFRKI